MQCVIVRNWDLEQESSATLNSLGLKTTLSKIPLFGDIFFWRHKMNKVVNKFLLAGDKFIPELHLRQLGITYNACRIAKNKEKIQKFKEKGYLRYICQNELNKAYFQQDMVIKA